MELSEQLDTIVASLTGIAGGVRPDQFGNETPCANFKVRDVFDHMIQGASQLGPQLRGETPDPVPDGLTDEERLGALKTHLDDLVAAAKSPGAGDRIVQAPFGEIPGSVLVQFLTVDGMVHTTDIARATGQTYDPDPALAAEVLASAQQLIAPELRDGDTFAAETTVPDDASSITKLVAFTGRAI
jgi:uncharacterized protein (TIGR03086 family)